MRGSVHVFLVSSMADRIARIVAIRPEVGIASETPIRERGCGIPGFKCWCRSVNARKMPVVSRLARIARSKSRRSGAEQQRRSDSYTKRGGHRHSPCVRLYQGGLDVLVAYSWRRNANHAFLKYWKRTFPGRGGCAR